MRLAMKNNQGFTLMELLVVMAISVILMGLILAPVAQSFAITRRAQAMVDAQDAARMALLSISREMGQAMYVYDNSSHDVTVDTTGFPGSPKPQTPIMLPVSQPSSGNVQWFALPGGKIDFILPKVLMHCNNPAHTGGPRDFPREKIVDGHMELYDWPECPYCHSSDVEARPKLPMEQDVTVVRYFLGLKYNVLGRPQASNLPGNTGWVSPWGKNVVDGTANQVVLYRVEFNPYDDTLFPTGMSMDQRLSDPLFFYRQDTASDGNKIADNWMRIARVVGVGKYEDLITATTNPDTGDITSVQPCITFHTASVENDTFEPTYSSDKMNDYPDAPPTVFESNYGYWTPDYRVDVFRGKFADNSTTPQGIDFYTSTQTGDSVIMRYEPSGSKTTAQLEFNISLYLQNGYITPPATGAPDLEMAFTTDANKGTVNFALQPARTNNAKSGPVCEYLASDINKDFKDAYAVDRGTAIRCHRLATFDSSKTGQYLKNARVVPGSEKIIGPDMTFGAHFGKPVRYERVSLALGDTGANQYRIDYDNGWIYFSRDPSLDLPETDHDDNSCYVQVYYLVYFNWKDDVVRGDYLTKSLINIHMGMRMFDPDSGKPYPVDLSDSVKIRNALR